VLRPVEADVDSEETPLFVDDRPLDADVEREETLLLVDDWPVDREPTPL
jgi:hypothetical protein